MEENSKVTLRIRKARGTGKCCGCEAPYLPGELIFVTIRKYWVTTDVMSKSGEHATKTLNRTEEEEKYCGECGEQLEQESPVWDGEEVGV